MRLSTAKEISQLLSVPPTWVYAEARKGAIPHVRLGRYVRFDRAEIERWIAERKERAA